MPEDFKDDGILPSPWRNNSLVGSVLQKEGVFDYNGRLLKISCDM